VATPPAPHRFARSGSGCRAGVASRKTISSTLLRDGAGKALAVLVEIEGEFTRPGALSRRLHRHGAGGDVGQWSAPPFSGEVRGGGLLGRGAAIPRRASPFSPMWRAISRRRAAAAGPSTCCSMPTSTPAVSAGVRAIWTRSDGRPMRFSLGLSPQRLHRAGSGASCAPGCILPARPRIRRGRADRHQRADQGRPTLP